MHTYTPVLDLMLFMVELPDWDRDFDEMKI